ncbi:MAG: helix-turn-helix transcriptional regulator [Armatimonadota bacterium]|nr:helix-turn-helix transcriptional regulator [Armatimonadota bacterium]
MPLTVINTAVPRTQHLTELLILHLLSRRDGLTEWSLRKEIERMSGGLWRPSWATVSKVSRQMLAEGYLEGRWLDPEGRRRRPMRITGKGRRRLEDLRREFKGVLLGGKRFLDDLCRELYGD